MPKVTSDRREVRLQRRLPDSFLNAVKERKEQGRPVIYTERDLKGILKFVSRRPEYHPLGTRLTPVDTDRILADARATKDRVRQERTKTLEERIEKPPLSQRISQLRLAAPPTPISKNPVLIDFRHLPTDRIVGIFRPKLQGTIRRLKVFNELVDIYESDPRHQESVRKLQRRLDNILVDIEDIVRTKPHEALRALDWGLKSIGQVDFKGIHKRFSKVVSNLAFVADGGYFEEVSEYF